MQYGVLQSSLTPTTRVEFQIQLITCTREASSLKWNAGGDNLNSILARIPGIQTHNETILPTACTLYQNQPQTQVPSTVQG